MLPSHPDLAGRLLPLILPPLQAAARPNAPVRLVRQAGGTGTPPETFTAPPGEPLGILRVVGSRWLVFPFLIHSVPASQVLRPSLYTRGADGFWSTTAVVRFPFVLMAADGSPWPNSLLAGEVVRPGLVPFSPSWQAALRPGDPVIFLMGLSRATIKEETGVDAEDTLFFAESRVWVADPAQFDIVGTGGTTGGRRSRPVRSFRGPAPSGWPLRSA